MKSKLHPLASAIFSESNCFDENGQRIFFPRKREWKYALFSVLCKEHLPESTIQKMEAIERQRCPEAFANERRNNDKGEAV